MRGWAWGSVGVVSVLFACNAPSLDGVTFSCAEDSDCPSGQVCLADSESESPACGQLSRKPIELGFSGPLEGPDRAYGEQVLRGIQACLDAVNDEGGVHGRRLKLRALNDDGDLALARANTLELLDVQTEVAGSDNPDRSGKNGVFAMLGAAGTGAALEVAPLCNKNHKLLFAPATGLARYLRDGTDSSYVFNVRVGLREEATAIVEYLARHRIPRVADGATSYRRILAVTRDDLVGTEAYRDLVAAFDQTVAPLPSEDAIPRFVHQSRDATSTRQIVNLVQAYLEDLLSGGADSTVSVAIVVASDEVLAATLVRDVKDWANQSIERSQRLDVQFINYSVVNVDELSVALAQSPSEYTDVRDGANKLVYADGILALQPVPSINSSAQGATRYRAALTTLDGESPSVASFEGYIGARLFVEALARAGREATADGVRQALSTEMRAVDLQLGTEFSLGEPHEAMDSVWATVLREAGKVDTPFVWRRGEGIVEASW